MSDAPSSNIVPEDRVRSLLMDEDEAIIGYNEVKAVTNDKDLIAIIDDIVSEENKHKGQLQAWLDRNNPQSAKDMKEGAMEGVNTMSKAWRDFKKSLKKDNALPNQVSVSDKLDMILAEQADIKTSVERLDDVVPELAGDMSALENQEETTEELDMPEEVDGLVYGDTMEGMPETDATNEVSTEGAEDTKPSETAEFPADTKIGQGKAPKKDEVGGEDVDDSTEQLEGEVGDEELIKISKKNFDAMKKMILDINKRQKESDARIERLEGSNKLMKSMIANMRSGKIEPVNKKEPSERTVAPMRKEPMASNSGLRKDATGKITVNTRPPVTSGYNKGVANGEVAQINKSLGHSDALTPIKVGMGTNANDVANQMAKRIEAYASKGIGLGN